MPSSRVTPFERHRARRPLELRVDADIFELAELAMCIVDTTGTIRRVNPAFCRTLGASAGALINEVLSSLTDPPYDALIEGAVAQDAAKKVELSNVVRARSTRADGTNVYVDWTMRPVLDSLGAANVLVQGVDVTALVSSEQEVRRLEMAQRVARLGSFEQDPDTGVLRATAELNRLLGIESRGPLSVEQLMTVVHPDDRAVLGAAIQACVVDHEPVDLVHRLMLPDGTLRWVHALAEWTETPHSEKRTVLGTIMDITERKVAEDTLLFEYAHDSLTGLKNRASFLKDVELALEKSQHQAKHLAVLLLDVDDFKIVNDSLGHGAGDELLIDLSHRLEAIARTSDTIARFGGDEFAILIESGDVRNVAQRVAQRIAEALRVPFIVADHDIEISASVGISVSDLVGNAGELLRDADLAMYVAKQRGRGLYELADAGMHEGALARLNLVSEMRHGVEHGEFEVYYQAIVNTHDASIAGTEALVRWSHPRRGLLPPGAFLALAETSGLIVPIGRSVRREACRQLAAWRRAGLVDDEFYMSVNLSPRQLAEPELVDYVASDLESANLPPRVLVLEITESALVGEFDAVNARLVELKATGLHIALDDYGTGYSSLARLSALPIDIIKIDKSFIDQICTSTEARVLVKSVVDVARALGQTTIAEGVEYDDQLQVLRELGATFIQGFLFAKPLPSKLTEHGLARLRSGTTTEQIA